MAKKSLPTATGLWDCPVCKGEAYPDGQACESCHGRGWNVPYKRLVFLNTSIVTGEGFWSYRKTGVGDVKYWLGALKDLPRLSAIGHDATAQVMSEILGEDIKVNRIFWQAEPGDVGVVLKVKGRLPEGVVLDLAALEEVGYELGFLVFVAATDDNLGTELGIQRLVEHALAEVSTVCYGGADLPGGPEPNLRTLEHQHGIGLYGDDREGWERARENWRYAKKAIEHFEVIDKGCTEMSAVPGKQPDPRAKAILSTRQSGQLYHVAIDREAAKRAGAYV